MRLIKRTLLNAMLIATALAPACLSKEYPVSQTYTDTEYRAEVFTEKYTDNRTTVNSVSGEYELLPAFSWSNREIYFSGIPPTWYYAYDILPFPLYDNIRLNIGVLNQLQYEKAVIRVFDMSKAGHIYPPDPLLTGSETQEEEVKWQWIKGRSSTTWLDLANIRIGQARFLAGRTNLWSRPDDPVLNVDAGKASKVAVILSGPLNQWNARITMSVRWTSTSTESQPITRERQVTRQVPYAVEKQKTVYQVKQVPFWEALFRR